MDHMTPADYIQSVMTQESLSVSDVSKRAADNGYAISAAYIFEVLKGHVENPSVKTVKALAAGLDKPESELLVVFGFGAES